jgi:hypothetical protein
LEFDTEVDRRTIFKQKFAVIVVCGLIIPLLACAATLWLL